MITLIAFDLGGTLALGKQSLTESMGDALVDLLTVAHIAITPGGNLPQFEKQVASPLPPRADLSKLWLMQTTGTKLYEYKHNEWQAVYAELLSDDMKMKVLKAFDALLASSASTPRRPGASVSRVAVARSPSLRLVSKPHLCETAMGPRFHQACAAQACAAQASARAID